MQWRFGLFCLDRDRACLWRGDERVALRHKLFDMLAYLVERAGALVSKDDLLEAICRKISPNYARVLLQVLAHDA